MAHTVPVPFRNAGDPSTSITEDLDDLAYERWLGLPSGCGSDPWTLFKKITASYALLFYTRRPFHMQDSRNTSVVLVSDILFVRMSGGQVVGVADKDVVMVVENIRDLM